MSSKSEAAFHGRVQTGAPDSTPGDEGFYGTEQETVGDWAGHTPIMAGVPELHEKWADQEGEAGILTNHTPQQESEKRAEVSVATERELISFGIKALVELSGTNSRDHGFHEDWPTDSDYYASQGDFERQIGLAITEKLALIHEEVSESLGEIRSGHDPLETYFVENGTKNVSAAQLYDDEDKPMLKPEGFLVELADAAIRIADLVYLVGGRDEFVKALEVKMEYNATRPYKHGRRF